MSVYLIETNEILFLHTFMKQQLANHHPFRSLLPHDTFLFLVEGRCAGFASTSTENALLFHRAWKANHRLQLTVADIECLTSVEEGEIKEARSLHHPLSPNISDKLLSTLSNRDSDIHAFYTNLEDMLEEAEKKTVQAQQAVRIHKMKERIRNTEPYLSTPSSTHTTSQFYLKEMAFITGCDVWTASNDKNRIHNREKLGSRDLVQFPNLHIEEKAEKSIQLIDTIWFKGNVPVACFEIELTSKIYSGLLRMSDVVASMPNKHLRFYIVSPRSRMNNVRKELNRPIFKQMGLHRMTRFISTEDLDVLYQKIKGLDGYIDPQVVDTISFDLNEITELVK